MTTIYESKRAARRAGFWSAFLEMLACPFAPLFEWLAWDKDESPEDYVNRELARYGLAPIDLAPRPEHEPDILTLAWRDTTQDFWRAFEQVEREYGAQIRAAQIRNVY